jgi:hypothetical protein
MGAGRLQPIETVVGFLSGRDAIFLDEFAYDTHHQLTLRGSFNGVVGSRPLDEEIDYEMTFSDVLAFTVVELESSRVYEFEETFSFAEVIGSGWLPRLAAGDKFTPEHRHYLVQTYDDLVEIVATGVAVQITGRRAASRD